MINLENKQINRVNIFKSNWNSEASTSFQIKLINDITLEEFPIDFLIIDNTKIYQSFEVGINTTSGFSLTIKDFGFHRLLINDGNSLIYTERVRINTDVVDIQYPNFPTPLTKYKDEKDI